MAYLASTLYPGEKIKCYGKYQKHLKFSRYFLKSWKIAERLFHGKFKNTSLLQESKGYLLIFCLENLNIIVAIIIDDDVYGLNSL